MARLLLPHPRSTLSLWEARPTAPAVLPCGSAFDVVNVPVVFGRRMLDRLWEEGPGSGPVAVHRGRMLLFAAPGTAHRLPALLHWEEWGEAIPVLLCHGRGDAIAVPALRPSAADPAADGPAADRPASRWLVAPDGRQPLAARARGAALGLRMGRPRRLGRGGAGIDFSSGGSGC